MACSSFAFSNASVAILLFASTCAAASPASIAAAIEAGDANAQVEANKRIATLAFENAKLEQAK